MQHEFARHYRELYLEHWWFRAREEIVVREIRALRLPDKARILDVGCGDGLFFDELKRFGQVEGVESDGSIVTDWGRARGTIHTQSLSDFFRPDRQYDLIVMLDTLEHIEDDQRSMQQVADMLAPSGHLLLTVPAFPLLWTRHDRINHHFRRYRHRPLLDMGVAAGLEWQKWNYLFCWLFPVKLGIRMMDRWLQRSQALPSIPPRPVNSLLESWSKLESRLQRFLNLPFGSTLLAVGRKPQH